MIALPDDRALRLHSRALNAAQVLCDAVCPITSDDAPDCTGDAEQAPATRSKHPMSDVTTPTTRELLHRLASRCEVASPITLLIQQWALLQYVCGGEIVEISFGGYQISSVHEFATAVLKVIDYNDMFEAPDRDMEALNALENEQTYEETMYGAALLDLMHGGAANIANLPQCGSGLTKIVRGDRYLMVWRVSPMGAGGGNQ